MRAMIAALFPIFSLIVIGALFRRYGFPGDAFWPAASRITYFAFFPALLLCELATANFTGSDVLLMSAALIIALLLLTVLLIAARRWLQLSNGAFTSVFQGSVRPNTYVGLSVAAALFGAEGSLLAAVAVAAMVPLVNLVCVVTLTRYPGESGRNGQGLLMSVITNPLIIACLLGIALNVTGIGLPFGTGQLVDIFSRAALPLGLLTVGAGLELSAARASGYPVALASVIKLGAFPLLTAGICALLGVDETARAVAILFAAVPCAPAAYVLAQQLGGDSPLMASILTVQTILAAVTLTIWLGAM
jgi:hypothetical protein